MTEIAVRPNFTKTLGLVVDLACEMIVHPEWTASRLPKITELQIRVEAERAAMIEGVNPIRGEVAMLLEALANIEAERGEQNKTRADDFCKIAGVLLPMVRRCLVVALHLGTRGPVTSDQDYHKTGRR